MTMVNERDTLIAFTKIKKGVRLRVTCQRRDITGTVVHIFRANVPRDPALVQKFYGVSGDMAYRRFSRPISIDWVVIEKEGCNDVPYFSFGLSVNVVMNYGLRIEILDRPNPMVDWVVDSSIKETLDCFDSIKRGDEIQVRFESNRDPVRGEILLVMEAGESRDISLFKEIMGPCFRPSLMAISPLKSVLIHINTGSVSSARHESIRYLELDPREVREGGLRMVTKSTVVCRLLDRFDILNKEISKCRMELKKLG